MVDLNLRFNVGVIFLWLIILSVVDDVSINSETFLTAFVNIKIKLTISFRGIYKNKMYIYIFIEINTHMCISIQCMM
jgi:hypothetical protein